MSSRAQTLFLSTALRAHELPGGGFGGLTRKFVEGVRATARLWGGPLVVLVARAQRPSTWGNLDELELRPAELEFGLEWQPEDEAQLAERIRGAAVSLGAFGRLGARLARLRALAQVPMVEVTEYSLRTRVQIVCAETRNPLLRARRAWWNAWHERELRAMVRTLEGVQCNGLPTYEAYRQLNPRALLFFDTRAREALYPSEPLVRERVARLESGAPLRLAFSGRLAPMKGALELVPLALELRAARVPFELDVYGAGPLEAELRAQSERHGLGAQLRLHGALDYETQLVPRIASSVDLFVCCHVQGDPSCTYLETMACGVPIAGYDNQAFAGLVRASGVGWTSPLGRPRALAQLVARLERERARLAAASLTSLEFARAHSFERTMHARVEHLRACAETARARR
jgi:colanic acid/amylovoran biosynthesis glycosyltransferase